VEDDKDGVASSDCFAPLFMPETLAVPNSEKAETVADSFEAQFQPVNDSSSLGLSR
jgi:hypothetical protein